jgi:ribonuclease T
LGGFFYNETVLARALRKARIPYNPLEAHGALYDALKTAELYCHLFNKKK